jgi:hypothetical protein
VATIVPVRLPDGAKPGAVVELYAGTDGVLDAVLRIPAPARTDPMTAEHIAQAFHEAYEALAPDFGYTTREASAKPWAEVPEQNKSLMVAVAQRLLNTGVIADVASQERSEEDRIRDAMAEAQDHPGRMVTR